MPSSCRILQFPQPASERWDPQAAANTASEYLEAGCADSVDTILDPDVLLAICSSLRSQVNVTPADVLIRASSLFENLISSDRRFGVFDEREYVLGELAHLAGKTSRILGKRTDTQKWLDRADSFFRQTVNPAPHLSSVAYDRLALEYENRDFEHVLEHTLPLIDAFGRLGMPVERAKTQYLRAATLKLVGRWDESFQVAQRLTESAALEGEPALLAQAWIEIGEYHAHGENYESASIAYEKALPLLESTNRPVAVFTLKVSLGETLRSQGRLEEALSFLRSACGDARDLQIETNLAYARLLTSETLLAMGRHREAEWEVYVALPIIHEQSMRPEGIAAINLLAKSLAHRKMQPSEVQAVRSFLQN